MFPKTTATGTHFKLWAETAEEVTLRVHKGSHTTDYLMSREADGYDHFNLEGSGHGIRYQYLINGRALPDPASTRQPDGVHLPSMVTDFRRNDWSNDHNWSGLPLEELIFYEIHIGTFTKNGTFTSTIERLDELVELGITAVQVMPLAQCPGKWNWGYDGVQLFAPNNNYGSPEELCKLVKACHERILAIYVDVVYNHLGSEGNYLGRYGSYFHQHTTPWGDSPDMSHPKVRAFFIENARYWIEQYHFDGIRFDAIAMIHDPSETHIMNEIGTLFDQLGNKLRRRIHAIGESNIYQPEFLPDHGGTMHALWSDDIGHAAEASVTDINTHGTRHYNGPQDFLDALKAGCLYYRTKAGHGQRRQSDAAPANIARCVNQLQNHDIVGNSPKGKRIHQYTSQETQCALAPLFLLYPAIPLLFMGEEFSAKNQFLFFTDFESIHLRKAVERGRANEFPQHSWDEAVSPTSPDAFYNSKLPSKDSGCFSTHEWYKALIRERKRWQASEIIDQTSMAISGKPDENLFIINYQGANGYRFVASNIGKGSSKVRATASASIVLQYGNVARLRNGYGLPANSAIAGIGNLSVMNR